MPNRQSLVLITQEVILALLITGLVAQHDINTRGGPFAMARKAKPEQPEEPKVVIPEKIPAEFTPAFKPEPINSKLNWWPHTARYLKVLRNKKTGQLRLDSTVSSHPDTAKIPPGTPANIADHEIMLIVDLTEMLDD